VGRRLLDRHGRQRPARRGRRGGRRGPDRGRSTPSHCLPDGSTGVELRDNRAASFYVHPSFAGLDGRDFYVRLTVRRLGPGKRGGSTCTTRWPTARGARPTKNCGVWFSLSAETGWQTHVWHVTDACFSKMWGYDISFRPEQSVPFVVGKVEVSRVAF